MAQKREGNAGLAEERLGVLKADHQAVLDCLAALTRRADVMQKLFAQLRHDGPATPQMRALLRERFNDFEGSQRDLCDAMQRAQGYDDQVRREYLAARQRYGRSGVTIAFGFTEVLARDVTLRQAKCVASPGIGTGEPGGPREELVTACSLAMEDPKDRQELAAKMRAWVKEKGGELARELRLEIEQIDKLKAEVEAEYFDVLGVVTGWSNVAAVGIPPGIETGRGKGNGENAIELPPAPERADDQAETKAKLDKLTPSVRLAYFSFLYAEAQAEERLEDREAYDWLQEHGINDQAAGVSELTDYQLPAFDTWSRYLRDARAATGEQKYTRRAGRPTGGSVVKGSEI